MLASLEGHIETAQLLIEKAANLNAKDKYGFSALILAIRESHTEMAKLLIKNGANVHTKDRDGRTPLIFASSFG